MKFPNAITSKLAGVTTKLGQHSPTIMFVAGTVGVVGTVVLASRATLKLDEVLDETRQKLDDIKTIPAERFPDGKYTDQERSRDRLVTLTCTSIEIAKLYAPAFLVGAASIGLLTGSHVVLNQRNAALTAAYATVQKSFDKYRARVREEVGDERERKIAYGVKEEVTTVVDDDGKKQKVKTQVATTSPTEYGRMFNNSNPNWNGVPEYNMIFLRLQQRYLNDELKAKGVVLLNDAYDNLGFERTKAGSVVGWTLNGDGDGYIDFGIFNDEDAEKIYEFCVGKNGELHLDFNVDGVVYDKYRI